MGKDSSQPDPAAALPWELGADGGEDWTEGLGEVCAVVRHKLGFDAAAITTIEDDGKTLRTVGCSTLRPGGLFDEPDAVRRLQDFPMLVEAARERQAWFCEDVSAAGARDQAGLLATGSKIRSGCAFPLVIRDVVTGFLLAFHFDQSHRYDAPTRETFTAMGRLAGISMDLSRTVRDLREAQHCCRELIELSGDLMVVWTPAGVIRHASPSAWRLCRATEGMTFDQFLERVHPDDRDHTQEAWETWIDAAETTHFGNRLLSIAEEEHRIQWSIHPVRSRTGELTCLQTVGHDLTSWHDLEQKIQTARLSESMVRLTGGFAHKFNNMLVSVLGNASLLASQLEANHPWRLIVDDIVAGADQAARLTRQLLTYARSTPHVPQRRRLRDLLAESLELGETALPSRIDLKIDIGAQDDWVEADPMQFQHMVINLVLNAAEAMPDGGTVSVQTADVPADPKDNRAQRGFAAIIIEDTGVGIAEDDLKRMFDPFFSTKEMGRGLGLAAVKGMVRAHSGKIEVQSEPGRGTRIRVLLPRCEPPAT